jgi:hypothetical protein
MVDVQGCTLTLSGVQKVTGPTDSFDPSDIFDQYTIDLCDSSITPTPTSTSTATNTSTPTYTPTNTATQGPTSTPTPTATNINTPTPTATQSFTATPTSTPTPGSTSTPTPTATTTNTPEATFTPTPTSAVTDVIFKDGFENGNFSAWAVSSTNGGNLSVSPNAALAGSYGMQATFSNTTSMYVRDDSPNAETRYRARFYFNPNSITMASGNYIYLLQGHDASNRVILFLQFYRSSTGYQLRVRGYDSVLANYVNTPYVSISNAIHAIELDWANDGHVTLWIDGQQQASLTGLNNSVYTMESVRIGAPYMGGTGISGTYYIDAYESRKQTYIGP